MPAETCLSVTDPYARPWTQGRKGMKCAKNSFMSVFNVRLNPHTRIKNTVNFINMLIHMLECKSYLKVIMQYKVTVMT